jgi:hypothetical protein
VKEKQDFVRLEMKKEDLLEMFKVSSIITPFQMKEHLWGGVGAVEDV